MKDLFSLIIAGSRDLSVSVARIEREIDAFICNNELMVTDQLLEIVSGGAEGVDRCGEVYARVKLKQQARIFPANWDKYGKAAGPKRNQQMAEYADAALVFLKQSKGPSPGSSNMIAWMGLLDKPCRVVGL